MTYPDQIQSQTYEVGGTRLTLGDWVFDKICLCFHCYVGSKIMENGQLFKELLQTPNFRITVVEDADTVELCGALKVTTNCKPHRQAV